jgi:hypothetical protein
MDENSKKSNGRLEWRSGRWWVVLSATEMKLRDFAELSDRLLYRDLRRERQVLARQNRRRSKEQQKIRNEEIAREQLIDSLARRFVRNTWPHSGGSTNVAMALGALQQQVWSYMWQWLVDHGELPTGEHIVPAEMHYDHYGSPPSDLAHEPRRIDFTKLANDPDYPRLGRDDTYVEPEDWPPPFEWKPK